VPDIADFTVYSYTHGMDNIKFPTMQFCPSLVLAEYVVLRTAIKLTTLPLQFAAVITYQNQYTCPKFGSWF
jgi:hypothetical protein